MKKRDDVYLSQIIERIDLIAKYIKGLTRAGFLKSDLHRSAVIRVLLTGDIVKSLIKSESAFKPKAVNRIAKRNFARGIAQVSDETRKILADEKGELRDHYLTLTADDVYDPVIGICACVRWLFRKRECADSFLGRSPTWEETIAEYKGYLRKKAPGQTAKGMDNFNKALSEIRGQKK